MNALAAQGADINYSWFENRGITPLMMAVCGAEFAVIDALIVAGVRFNASLYLSVRLLSGIGSPLFREQMLQNEAL